jgi:hypothetical protein
MILANHSVSWPSAEKACNVSLHQNQSATAMGCSQTVTYLMGMYDFDLLSDQYRAVVRQPLADRQEYILHIVVHVRRTTNTTHIPGIHRLDTMIRCRTELGAGSRSMHTLYNRVSWYHPVSHTHMENERRLYQPSTRYPCSGFLVDRRMHVWSQWPTVLTWSILMLDRVIDTTLRETLLCRLIRHCASR